jgi:hypothetical protein
MSMRRLAIALPLAAAGIGLGLGTGMARADTFGGFSGVDRPYLVNQDRVCQPIAVANSAAAGAPRCEKVAADAIARLSIKPPLVQSGAKASFTAQASGRTIVVSRKAGGTVVAWDAPDPVVKIVDLYASQYEDRLAVAYSVRRAGKEVTDVVAFDLGQNQTAVSRPTEVIAKPTIGGDPSLPPAPGDTAAANAAANAPPPPPDPRVVKLMADARAAPRGKAVAAWAAVLAADAGNAEALFRTAAAQLAAKHTPEALAALEALAASPRGDAIEWQVEARFDPAFAGVRGDPKFRAAVGLDRKPTTPYERLMGLGGQWEQTGTSCDKPEVRLVATRDRKFRLRVKTRCEGSVFDTPFSGTWRVETDRVVLQLPNRGRDVTASDEAGCLFEVIGDEDALRCSLGRDLEFVVLPTRR